MPCSTTFAHLRGARGPVSTWQLRSSATRPAHALPLKSVNLDGAKKAFPAAAAGGSGQQAGRRAVTAAVAHREAMTTRIDTGTRRSSDSPSILVEVQGKSLKLGGSVELLRNAPFTTCSRPGGNPDADEVILGFNSDQSRSLVDINLGPVKCTRWLACARNKLWWMTPSWGSTMSEVPTETQFFLMEHGQDGPYSLLLPLIDGSFRAVLKADRNKNLKVQSEALVLRIDSGDETVKAKSWDSSLLVVASWDLFEAVRRGMALAASLSGDAKPLHMKEQPASLDYFGWCTWDAFYSGVCAQGLEEGLRSLQAGGVQPRTLIIDDGWQSVEVDEVFKESITTRALRRMRMPATETMDEEFDESEISVLAAYADMYASSRDLANTMPALSDTEFSEKLRKQVKHRRGGAGAPPGPTGTIDIGTTSIDASPGGNASGSADAGGSNGVGKASEEIAASAGSQGRGGLGKGLGKGGRQVDLSLEATSGEVKRRLAEVRQELRADVQRVQATVQRAQEDMQRAMPDIEDTVAALSKEPKNMSLWSKLVQRTSGWALGFVQVAFLMYYRTLVDPAHPNSFSIYFFEYLASGPLKWNMLQFYKASGDFTKRIISVRANGKFAHPSAGPNPHPHQHTFAESHEMKGVTDYLRKEFGIDYIYCWHGLPSYWGGCMPGSAELAHLNPRLVFPKPSTSMQEIEPSMRWNPAVLAGIGIVDDPAQLYNQMHRYLAAAGVDGVKVDCQAGLGLVGSVTGGGSAISNTFHAALEDSISLHFPGNHAINCMCHSTDNLYRMRDTAIVRASDDFYPREPASTTPHIAACAYNSLFLAELALPDWDMFQSQHAGAQLHACARAISGGAVYVSDKPGKHDTALLRTMVLRDGTVLRTLLPSRPTADSVFSDPLTDGKTVLKTWSRNAHSGVVGLFNLQGSSWNRTVRQFVEHDAEPPMLQGEVRPADVECMRDLEAQVPGGGCGRFAVFLQGTGALSVAGMLDRVPVPVGARSADILTIVPVVRSPDVSVLNGSGNGAEGSNGADGAAASSGAQQGRGAALEFAPIGHAAMLNTGGSVIGWSSGVGPGAAASEDASAGNGSGNGNGAAAAASGQHHEVRLRGEGRFVAYSNARPTTLTLDGRDLDADCMQWGPETNKLEIVVPDTYSASVDHTLVLFFE